MQERETLSDVRLALHLLLELMIKYDERMRDLTMRHAIRVEFVVVNTKSYVLLVQWLHHI